MAAITQRMVPCDDKLQLQATVVLAAVKFAFDVGFRSLDVDMSFSELYHLLQSASACWLQRRCPQLLLRCGLTTAL
jgi:hypothetical protein